MNWQVIQQFFRGNPLRAWLVVGGAALALILSIWGIWGGFSLQYSQFFAASAGPQIVINSSLPVTHGSKLSVSWSANTATSCTSSGWIDTGGKNEGTAESDAVNACGAASGTFEIKCCYPAGDCGVTRKTFAINTSTCPGAGGTPTPTAGGPTPTGGGSGFPVDPSGKCVFRTNFNAPAGAWFCESLQCNLAGNPPFDQGDAARKPPEGPAVRLAVNVMGQGPEQVDPAAGPINIRTKLDSTPKCSNGKECYPPKDPLWSCTQENGHEVDLGRNGHDYYDCYNPIIHRRENGKITCCANTGLAGDCFTWDYQGGPLPSGGASPSPTTSAGPATPTPTPVNPLLKCAPIEQTVALKEIATVTASGGNGKYTWELSGSGVQQGGTANSVQVSYSVSGQKVVRASSGGQIATCVVTVSGTGGGGASPLTVIKRGYNASTGSGGESSAITINPNEYAQFRISITNNGSTDISGLTLRDTLPTGMTYRLGSTTINGQSVSVDTITAGGLVLDNLIAGGNMNVQWSAVADGTAQLAAGPHQSQPKAVVSGSGIADATTDMSVTVYSSGTIGGTDGTGSGGAGGVPTGPGDAVTIALVMAAALTLLYSGYTRSAAYRRHDADVVSRDQGPMDFKS